MEYSKKEIDNELDIINNSKKPKKYTVQQYPLNELTSEQFELLIYLLFNKYKQNYVKRHDNCNLVSGPGDKGRDITLSFKSQIISVIQCKRYTSKLDKKTIVKEILKFVLFAFQDSSYDFKSFKYLLATTTGLNHEATSLVESFNSKVIKEKDLEKWIIELKMEYKGLETVDFKNIKTVIYKILREMKVETLLPIDINNLIKTNPSIIPVFFDVERVIDIESFERIVTQSNLDVKAFLEIYKVNVINNFLRVNFFGLALSNRPREVPLHSLFVKPNLKIRGINSKNFFNFDINELNEDKWTKNNFSNIVPSNKSLQGLREKIFLDLYAHHLDKARNITNGAITETNNNDITKFDSIFNHGRHLTVLGKPGAGKSSVIKIAICNILDNNDTYFSDTSIFSCIPFRIELNKYNSEKKEKGLGLIDYLAFVLNQEYQINFVSKNALNVLFENYETVVFFDGLDEVLDVHERIQVRNDIENFIENNKNARSVVTSRFESYNEVFLDQDVFNVLEVMDFDDDQVIEYVNKWYSIEESLKELRIKELDRCLIELEKIEDELKRTPLLLTLILILYRNALELPTTKLEIYEGCTHTLVETRDVKEKKLNFKLRIKNIIATFSSLAFWQYQMIDEKNQDSINYNSVMNHIKKYLLEKGEFEEDTQAQFAAEDFLEFSKIRSIYIENNFSHKTFLEYFTAYYIYANMHAKGKFHERDDLMSKHIGKSSWHVILELLICKIDNEQPDFEIIDSIIDKQLLVSKEDSLSFFLLILKYLKNISKNKIKEIIKESIKFCVFNVNKEKKQARIINNNLLQLSKNERHQAVVYELINELNNEIKGDYQAEQNYVVFLVENTIPTEQYFNFLTDNNVNTSILDDPYINILLLINSQKDLVESVESFVKMFGKRALMKFYPSKFGNNIFFGGNSFNWIIYLLFSHNDLTRLKKSFYILIKYVSLSEITKTIENDRGSINITKANLLECFESTPNNNMKKIFKTALVKYYKVPQDNSNIPFYKKVNMHKRFPKPK